MTVTSKNQEIEKCLNELSGEYKELLYKALISRSQPLDDLSVSELLRLDNEIKKPLSKTYQRQQRQRKQLVVIGLTYILVGLSISLVLGVITDSLNFSLDNILSIIANVVSVIGLLFTLYSCVSKNLRLVNKTTKKEENIVLEYEIVANWREIEGIVKDINVGTNVKGGCSAIDFLLDNKLINEEEYKVLKVFLKLRNSVVHSDTNNCSYDEMNTIIEQVDKIKSKIKKILCD